MLNLRPLGSIDDEEALETYKDSESLLRPSPSPN